MKKKGFIISGKTPKRKSEDMNVVKREIKCMKKAYKCEFILTLKLGKRERSSERVGLQDEFSIHIVRTARLASEGVGLVPEQLADGPSTVHKVLGPIKVVRAVSVSQKFQAVPLIAYQNKIEKPK